MSDYEKFLVKNVVVLLLTPRYMSPKQHEASEIMAHGLMAMNGLDKEVIRVIIQHSCCLCGRTSTDRKIIQTAIEDLYYLRNLKGV